MKKRIISVLLSAGMVFSMFSTGVAAEGTVDQTTENATLTACAHLTHDENCGYTEASENTIATPCNHICAFCVEAPGETPTEEPKEDVTETIKQPILAETAIVTAFADLSEEVQYQRQALTLPETLFATVNGEEITVPVIWNGQEEIAAEGKAGGFFILEAAVGEGYAVDEGVEFPKIAFLTSGGGRAAGLGTEINPIKIKNETQLREIADIVNEEPGSLEAFVFGDPETELLVHLSLVNDIDLSTGYDWNPIGEYDSDPDNDASFRGVFDGQGHVVRGMTLNRGGKIGLFGSVKADSNSVIKNIGLENVFVDGNGDDMIGGLVGYLANNQVINCYVTGEIGGGTNVGGIVGKADNGSLIAECFSTAKVYADVGGTPGDGNSNAGGIVGAGYEVNNCYSTGSISATAKGVGGIAGYAEIVRNCYATGSIEAYPIFINSRPTASGDYAGGIVGYSGAVTIENCVALNPSISIPFPTNDPQYGRIIGFYHETGSVLNNNYGAVQMGYLAGGISGNTYPAMPRNGDTMQVADFLNTMNTIFTGSVWSNATRETLPSLLSTGTQTVNMPLHLRNETAMFNGEGTKEKPYLIQTVDDLFTLAELVNGDMMMPGVNSQYAGSNVHYKQTVDIDLDDEGVYAREGDWEPIGNLDSPFMANYDGGGFKISNMSIVLDDTDDNVGLFGYIDQSTVGTTYVGGHISNIALTDVHIFVRDLATSNTNNVGAIVGNLNRGTVTNCYATGFIKTDGENAGGLVGKIGQVGIITYSYSTVTVDADDAVGGIVGHIDDAATIVTVEDNFALNKELKATKSVSNPSFNKIGRIWGYRNWTPSSSATVRNHGYESMTLDADRKPDEATNAHQYGTDISAENIQGETTRVLSGGQRLWQISDAGTLPSLKAGVKEIRPDYLMMAVPFEMDRDEYFLIGTEEQLRILAGLVNTNGTFTTSSGSKNYSEAKYKLVNDIILTSEWEPIGTKTSSFKGIFDGNNKTIRNLSVEDGTIEWAGLFGYADSAVIISVGLKNVYFEIGTDQSTAGAMGGIVGHVTGDSLIQNCFVEGSFFSFSDYAGGIAGYAENTRILNCYAAVNLDNTNDGSSKYAGGILGYANNDVEVYNCYAMSTQSSGYIMIDTDNYGAGIVGYIADSNSSVTSCVALIKDIASYDDAIAQRIANIAPDRTPTLADNYAFSAMDINLLDESIGVDTVNGEDVDRAELATTEFWKTKVKSNFALVPKDSHWVLTANRLPYLKSFDAAKQFVSGDIPLYLTEMERYTVEYAVASGNGSITSTYGLEENGQKVGSQITIRKGEKVDFVITPSSGYRIGSVYDGETNISNRVLTDTNTGVGTLIVNKIDDNYDIKVNFVVSGYVPSYGGGGGGGGYAPSTGGGATSGWQENPKGDQYYENGKYVTGWQKIHNIWYNFDQEGTSQTGWLKDTNGKWYYLNSNGAMNTGWKQVDGKWYLLGGNGAMQTDWQMSGSKWYLLGSDGAMKTGWQKVDGKWYLLNASGAMLTGWQNANGNWYYLYQDGTMAVNTTVLGYTVGGNGAWIR